MTYPFNGTGVALITPFKEDFSIDFDALGNIVEDQISNGTEYLVVLGTTAETPTLSEQEKKEIVRFIIEKNNSRLPVVVGMGSNNTAALTDAIKKTDFTGIDGILSVTPYYNKPSQEGMFHHFKAVAEASPVPVILYNVPSRTGVNMEAETSLRIAQLSDKIVGIKEASGESSQVAKMVKGAPDYFKVISGDDVLALPVVSVGGIGVISVIANALPAPISQLVKLALHNNIPEARELHLKLVHMFKLLFREGNPGGIKATMEILGKAKNIMRLPMYPVSQETYSMLEAELKKIHSNTFKDPIF